MNTLDIFEKQKFFFKTKKTLDLKFRKIQLELLESVLKKNEKKLFDAVQKDFGKSEFDSLTTELGLIYLELKYYRKNLSRLARPKRVRTNLLNLPGSSFLHYDPYGNVLVIGAWNYPLLLTLGPALAALAAGNTVVIKPSETAESTMKALREVINSNFSPEVLHVVEGDHEIASKLLEHRWDKIFFTGSSRVGKIVYEAAAKHLTPVTLELGGKSPAIVSKWADLDLAAKRIVWGKFLNGGQTCVAPDFVLVDEAIKTKLLERVVHYIKKFDYKQGASHFTRIINEKHFDRLESLLEGPHIFYSGERNRKALHFGPTVLSEVNWDHPVMQEEIFGPILPVLGYSNFESILSELSTKEKPLAAYLFTSRSKERKLFTSQYSFGGGCINDVLMHVSNKNLPFGGVGNSGMGNYHGVFGFKTFSHEKALFSKATWGEPDLKYPPYTKIKWKWIQRLFNM